MGKEKLIEPAQSLMKAYGFVYYLEKFKVIAVITGSSLKKVKHSELQTVALITNELFSTLWIQL